MPTTKSPIIVRGQVRSQIYRSAFSAPSGAYGFLVGDWQDRTIDFALPVAALHARSGFYDAPRYLDIQRAAADRVAEFAQRTVCGAFISFDSSCQPDTNQLIGLFIDYLRERRLVFLIELSTTAQETIWGISIFWAGAFPQAPLPYRMARRQSAAPHHNPRRIQALWRESQQNATNVA